MTIQGETSSLPDAERSIYGDYHMRQVSYAESMKIGSETEKGRNRAQESRSRGTGKGKAEGKEKTEEKGNEKDIEK